MAQARIAADKLRGALGLCPQLLLGPPPAGTIAGHRQRQPLGQPPIHQAHVGLLLRAILGPGLAHGTRFCASSSRRRSASVRAAAIP